MRRSLTALALTVLATLALGAAPPARAADNVPPGLGIRLVDVPVATANDPRARSYIIDHVRPGAVIERRVEVSNGTPDQADVAMYPGAATIRDGKFSDAVGRTQNELSNWISLDRTAPVLDPQQRALVQVTITVPIRASRGERYAVVWAEVRSSPDRSGVTHVSRVGIRVYLSVGAGGDPPSDFRITSVTAARDAQGTPILRAKVHNTGERALDLRGRLRLSEGPGGVSAGPFLSEGATTLGVDQTGPVSVLVNKELPRGPWLARISVTSGLVTRTAQAKVTFPGRRGVAATVPVEDGIGWWVWALAGAVLLVALLVLLLAALRRRRSRPTNGDLEADHATEPTLGKGN